MFRLVCVSMPQWGSWKSTAITVAVGNTSSALDMLRYVLWLICLVLPLSCRRCRRMPWFRCASLHLPTRVTGHYTIMGYAKLQAE